MGSRSRDADSSSGGLALRLMALVGVDVSVKKVGCWGWPGTDPARVWWEKGSRCSAAPSQSWCHPRKGHPCLLPTELEENTGLLPEKLKPHLSEHWWAWAAVLLLGEPNSFHWAAGTLGPPTEGKQLGRGGVRDLFPLCRRSKGTGHRTRRQGTREQEGAWIDSFSKTLGGKGVPGTGGRGRLGRVLLLMSEIRLGGGR